MMNEPLQIAEVVRQACLTAALRAYEDAGLSGFVRRDAGSVRWRRYGPRRSARCSRG